MEMLSKIADRFLPVGESLQCSFHLGLTGSIYHCYLHSLLKPYPPNSCLSGALNYSLKWFPSAPTYRQKQQDSFPLRRGKEIEETGILAKLSVIPPHCCPEESGFSKISLPGYTFYKLSGEPLVKYALKILRSAHDPCLRNSTFSK